MISKTDIRTQIEATIEAEVAQHSVKQGDIQKEVDVIINNDHFYHDDTDDYRDVLQDYVHDGSMSLYD